MSSKKPSMIIGASGFVGKALAKELNLRGEPLILTYRSNPINVNEFEYPNLVQTMKLDLLKKVPDLKDVKNIYYLVHSMRENSSSFDEEESLQATNMMKALNSNHRVIYLGGIASQKESTSKHLESRLVTGQILSQSQAHIIELRASIIIGERSSSFLIAQKLIVRSPLLPEANWMHAKCMPLSEKDLIDTMIDFKRFTIKDLKSISKNTSSKHHIIELEGPESLSYFDFLLRIKSSHSLSRTILKVPLLKKELVIEGLRVILPEDYQLARSLMTSIEKDTSLTGEYYSYKKTHLMPLDEALKLYQVKDLDLLSLKNGTVKVTQYYIDTLKNWSDQEVLKLTLLRLNKVEIQSTINRVPWPLPLKVFISGLNSKLDQEFEKEISIPFVASFKVSYTTERNQLKELSLEFSPKELRKPLFEEFIKDLLKLIKSLK